MTKKKSKDNVLGPFDKEYSTAAILEQPNQHRQVHSALNSWLCDE
jgi:hypothetical protein